MRLAIVGQQSFGKAVLEAALARGDEVVAVFCAPEEPGAKADPLRERALEGGLDVFEFRSLKSKEAIEAIRDASPEVCLLAYAVQFAPQEFVAAPKFGSLVFHPSLLPKHRGPSSINWPIIQGATMTGLTIFRPTDGLDEGPIVLQKEVSVAPEETLGDVYFNKIFPAGVDAMLEAADLVASGRQEERVQDESEASYEGWCGAVEAKIDWAKPVEHVFDLIRGCNPAPGAWTTVGGRSLHVFDVRKHRFRTFADVVGKPGEVSDLSDEGFKVTCGGGRIEVLRARAEGGPKTSAAEASATLGIEDGTLLGSG
jgi:methionyl-tRNA formyltransferase